MFTASTSNRRRLRQETNARSNQSVRRTQNGIVSSSTGGRARRQRVLEVSQGRRGEERPTRPVMGEAVMIGSIEEEVLQYFRSSEAIPIPIHVPSPQSSSLSPTTTSAPSTLLLTSTFSHPRGRNDNATSDDDDDDDDDDVVDNDTQSEQQPSGFFRFRRLRGGRDTQTQQSSFWPSWLRVFWQKKLSARPEVLEDELSMSYENLRSLPNAWAQAMRRRSSTDSLLAIARYVQEEREASNLSRRGSRRDSREHLSVDTDDSLLSNSASVGNSRKNSAVSTPEDRSELLSSFVDFSRSLSRRSSKSSSTVVVVPVDSDTLLSQETLVQSSPR